MTNLNDKKLDTAVLFLVFNRPDETKNVFESICSIKPPRLYIASDGPRDDKENNVVRSIRKHIISKIDWKCEVKTLFRDENLGCKVAVSEAIDWFFDNEEMGIILEDDCLPSKSFFWYCEDLLNKYKTDHRVGMISGNLPYANNQDDADYFFSRYTHIWGWATWKRAWRYYDVNLSFIDDFNKIDGFYSTICNHKEGLYWKKVAEDLKDNKVDTWDFQWLITCWSQSMLSVVPSVNLISNLGFGPGATHTSNVLSDHNNAKKFEISTPLKHPRFIVPNKHFDNLTVENEFVPTFKKRVLYKIKAWFL